MFPAPRHRALAAPSATTAKPGVRRAPRSEPTRRAAAAMKTTGGDRRAFTPTPIINLTKGADVTAPGSARGVQRYQDSRPFAGLSHVAGLEPNIETGAAARRGLRLRPRASHHAQRREALQTRSGGWILRPAKGGHHESDYVMLAPGSRGPRDGDHALEVSFRSRSVARRARGSALGAITPATKVLHSDHTTSPPDFSVSGSPRSAAAASRPSVDGRTRFAHFPYRAADIRRRLYGTSMKMVLRPSARIPLRARLIPRCGRSLPPPEKDDDIRKSRKRHHPAANTTQSRGARFHKASGSKRRRGGAICGPLGDPLGEYKVRIHTKLIQRLLARTADRRRPRRRMSSACGPRGHHRHAIVHAGTRGRGSPERLHALEEIARR